VTVLWAAEIDQSADWIRENPDLAALVVDVDVDRRGCASLLKHVRGLGLKSPVIVVAPDGEAPSLASLEAGAYDFVAKDDSLPSSLRRAVTRAVERGQAHPSAGVPFDGVEASPVVSHTPDRGGEEGVATAAARGGGIAAAAEGRLADLEAALRRSAHTRTIDAAAADRRAELEDLVQRERAANATLEQKLAHAEAALHEAELRHSSAMQASAAQLAEARAQYEVAVARATATWDMVGEQMREAALEVERAHLRESSTAAELDRLTRREREVSALLAEATSARATLDAQVAETRAALETAIESAARERLAAAGQAAERQQALEARIEQEIEKRQDLEARLAHAASERDAAVQRHASDVADAAARHAEQRARLEATLTAAASARDDLARKAHDLEEALARAREDLASNAATIQRLTRRETELVEAVNAAGALRTALERRLAATEAAFRDADERSTRERIAVIKKSAAHEAELDAQLVEERAARAALEARVTELQTAAREAQERHASALSAAAAEAAARQKGLESSLADAASGRESLAARLAEAEAAAESARRDHASAAVTVERLGQREAELAALLTGAETARLSLDRRVAELAVAMQQVDERAVSDRTAAAVREAELEAQRNEESRKREALESELAALRSTAADAERWFREESVAAAARAQEHAAHLEAEVARERRARETDLAQAHAHWQQQLEDADRNAQQAADSMAREHAARLAALSAAVSERDALLAEQASRQAAAQSAAAEERAHLQEAFRKTLAARNREIDQIQTELKTTVQKLEATRRRSEELQAEAARARELRQQLEERGTAQFRQFEQSPLALCRVTRGGELIQANPAMALLLGRGHKGGLETGGFAASVFESPDDLSWLIERCLETGGTETIETTWRNRSGGRLAVRLSAFASDPDAIEIVAEDLTKLHALKDRLSQAYRMEAIGRLASEVAVTCGNLLRDVHRDAERWLATVAGSGALRQQGEMMLSEVTRAAAFLKQLAAYSDEETGAMSPVDLTRVLGDLAPVLERVAGDSVTLEVPAAAAPLVVDVRSDRLERLFVTLASLARQRMPSGGGLRIELAEVVVDQRFVAAHPEARQGPHALITATETRRVPPAGGPPPRHPRTAGPAPGNGAAAPGMDLGPLQGLIDDCGGRLWMTIQPQGGMVAKIHLPLSASTGRNVPRPAVARGNLPRVAARWFQH
jgi:hypothetical protein